LFISKIAETVSPAKNVLPRDLQEALCSKDAHLAKAENSGTGTLLGEQPQMAGDAQPFSIFSDPRVGEATSVFVMLAFVRPLFVRCPGDDHRVTVAVKFHVF
jgi:hypothetical protein